MGLNELDQAVEDLAQSDNPYDRVVEARFGAAESKLRVAQQAAQETSPDAAAEAQKLAQRTGLPVDLIGRNLDAIRKRALVADTPYAQMQRETPALADWYSKPQNAAVASDDLPHLSTVERLFNIGRNVVGSAGAGVMDFSEGVWGAVQAGLEHPSGPPPLAPGQRAIGNVDLYAQPKVANPDGTTSTVDSRSFNFDGKEVLLPSVTPDGRHLQSDDEVVAEYEKTGRHLGIFDSPEAATAYAEQLHNRYAAGEFDSLPLSLRAARFAGDAAAVAKHLAERMRGPQTAAGLVERGIYGGIESLGNMAPALVTGALTGPAGMLSVIGATTGGQTYAEARRQGAGVSQSLAAGGIQGAIEVATEFIPAHRLLGDLAAKSGLLRTLAHQIAPEIIGEEVATALQDLNEWALLPANKTRTFADYLRERPSAAAATAISTIVAVGSTTVAAHGTARLIERLGETVAESKTAVRMPEAVESFVAQATKDTPVETVYAPIDTFTTYWQSKGIDPALVAQELTGSATAYQQAVQTGGDLAIPTASYAVKLAGTEHNAFFAKELRLAPEQMNTREAEEFEKASAETTEQPTETAPVDVSPIRQNIVDQLTAAGTEQKTAESYATLYEQTFQSLGERAGMDPVDLFHRYGLSIGREGFDTRPLPAQTVATDDAAVRGAGEGARREGRAAAGGVPSSLPRRSYPNERTRQHFDNVLDDLTEAARRLDPAVTADDLRPEFEARLVLWDDMQQAVKDGGKDPKDLLKAVAAAGGLGPESAGGLTGELARLKDGLKFGAVHGIQKIFRAKQTLDAKGQPLTGLGFDVMLQRLQQDPRFAWIENRDMLIDALDDAIRHPLDDELPNAKELAKALGMTPDHGQWWKPADDSFNVDEFNQGAKDAAGGLFDVLDTGEVQPRLPEAGAVRDQENKTPEFEAPFSLTSPTAKPSKRVQQTTLFQAFFHGSPHDFDRFDLSKIGTGQGAQSFGHGLYFAENHGVAESYRVDLSSYRYEVGGRPITTGVEQEAMTLIRSMRLSDVKLMVDRRIAQGVYPKAYGEAIKTTAEQFDDQPIEKISTGKLYQVEIPDEQVAKFLDWDKPLGQQAPEVQRALGAFGESPDDIRKAIDVWKGQVGKEGRRAGRAEEEIARLERRLQQVENITTGGEFYQSLAHDIQGRTLNSGGPHLAISDAKAQVSKALLEAGIPGIKYLDAGSRADSDGTYNVVVFDDSIVKLTHKDGSPVTAQERREFFQGERGKISFGDDRQFAINLLANADLSTFLHESGHFFLEVMRDLAPQSEQIAADLATIEATYGADNTAQHEGFATAFEAYLMEGKAPSAELRPVFARFRAWLTGVYRSLRGLNVQLTDDVRRVFDRLVASDQAIEQAETEGQILPLFLDAESAGMTDEQFAAYLGTVQQASDAARTELQDRVMRDLHREQTAEYKAARKEIRAAVKEEYEASPIYQAKAAKGVPLAVRAELYGFSSADELQQALDVTPSLTKAVAEETTRRLKEKFGDVLLDGSLYNRAVAAVNGEHRQRVVFAELKALNQGLANAVIPPAKVLNSIAETRIAGMTVRSIKPGYYLMAAQRASAKAFNLKETDRVGAVTAKQQELLNLALYREANRVKDLVEAATDWVKAHDTDAARGRMGKAGDDYLDQWDGILDRFEFKYATQKALDRRANLADWITAQEAEGLPVDLPAVLLNEARKTNYTELTVDEFGGVIDGLKQIAHLARLKNKLLTANDQQVFGAAVETLTTSIREKNDVKKLPLEFLPKDLKARKVSEWFAAHAKIATLARALDGYADGGAMWEYVIRPINEAATREASMNHEATVKLHALMTEAYTGRELAHLHDKTFIPAINDSLSKEARLSVALNWGNEGNRQRLADGRKWTPEQVQAILDTLDARDVQFVNDVWAYVNSFWPEIVAKQKRVTGLAPEKVEASQFRAAGGTFTGGYYPLVYDQRLSARAGSFIDATDANLQKQASYVRATTKRGHLEARAVRVTEPVRLELSVLYGHVEQVIHDLSHHEMLIDVGRVLGNKAVQSAIYETAGDQVYSQFKGALKDIAYGTRSASTTLERSLNFIRHGTTVAGLAWNVWTAVQQPLGVFNGMERVGPSWVAKGMTRMLRDASSMESTAAWVSAKSELMLRRSSTWQREISELRNTVSKEGGWFNTAIRTVTLDHLQQEDIADSYFALIGAAQRLADLPTWIGQYEKSLASGEEEARAIALADQAVLDSQGGGQIKDLAQAQRGSAAVKLFTNFYSYGNLLYNQTAEAYGKTNFRKVGSVGQFTVNLMLLYAFPAFATVMLAKAFDKDDDKESFVSAMGKEMIGAAMNTMLVLREFGGLVKMANRGYDGPAGVRLIASGYNLAQQVQQGKADRGLARAAEDTAGILFRLPLAQVQRSVDGFVALQDGKTHNPLVVFTGAPRKVAK